MTPSEILRKHEDANEMHLHHVDRKWIIEAMEEYAAVKSEKPIILTPNLNVSHFRNGDEIKECRSNEEWIKAGESGTPAWCYYDNDPTNGEKYGKLYNWYAVNDPRGLAPKGYHIPSDEEMDELEEELKKGLPGGYRYYYGLFHLIGYYGFWWSSTQFSTTLAWGRNLNYSHAFVFRDFNSKSSGFSVRCVRDKY